MLRRLLACGVAVVTLSAPVLVTVCQLLCAGDAAVEGTVAVEHSCHESAPPAGDTVSAVPHACGHATEALTGLDEWAAPGQSVSAPPAILEATPWTAPPLLPVLRGAPAPVDHSPPGYFPLASQLRV
jgi:hypothetical protein